MLNQLSDLELRKKFVRKVIVGISINNAAFRSSKIRRLMKTDKVTPVFMHIDNKYGHKLEIIEKLPALVRFEEAPHGRPHIRYFQGETCLGEGAYNFALFGQFNDREASGDLFL